MTARTELAGLQGASWTGYLAALGVLRLLTEAGLPVRMGWGAQAPYAAWLEHPPLEGDDLAARLAGELERNLDAFDPFPDRSKLSQVSPSGYRDAVAAAMERGDRLGVDLLAAFGSDAAFEPTTAAKAGGEGKAAKGRKGRTPRKGAEAAGPAEAPGGTQAEAAPPPEGGLLDPPWCVLDGAQQRNLFAIVRRLRELATPPDPAPRRGRRTAAGGGPLAERVRSVLKGPWQENDEKASLCLGPSVREHAYRWMDPTKDPPRSDGIANLLALVGLSLLPAVPLDRGGTVVLSSACCAVIDGRRTAVSWPIWRGVIGFGAARRLLLLPGITEEEPPADLAARGIVAVLRAEIHPIEGAKGAKTYTHPEPVWWA